MALQQAVGATVSVSAALPATHDDTGFEALTYTKVSYASGIPAARGTRDIAQFDNLETGQEHKFPDVIRAGNDTITMGHDDTDAGQAILETAADAAGDSAKASIKIALADGTTYYRTAIVTSFIPGSITVGNVVMGECGLEFYNSTVKVDAA